MIQQGLMALFYEALWATWFNLTVNPEFLLIFLECTDVTAKV